MHDWKPKKKASSQRWVVIGGGLVVVLLLIVLMASTASVDSFLYLGLDTLKRTTVAKLDPASPPALRGELLKAFDCVIAGATSGELGEEQVGGFSKACRAALEDEVVTREEAAGVRDLALALCGRR